MNRLFLSAIAVFATVSLQAQNVTWEKSKMDGSRTGVTTPGVDGFDATLGTVKGRTYYAPNGKKFRKGSTKKVAGLMIEAQPKIAYVREVIGYSTHAMPRKSSDAALYNFASDIVKEATEKAVGKKVDIGLINSGGIRVDMREGDILVDDILSMFPFKNYLCYVALKGKDVRVLFERMARGHVQPVSGVTVTVKDRQLVEILVGGEPLDDEKVYGLATVDFLLNGGDNIFAARNAVELIQSEVLMNQAAMDYIRSLTAQGKQLDVERQQRVRYLED